MPQEKNNTCKCDVCEKVFNYASNLRQHMLMRTGKFIRRPGREG